MGKAPEVVCGTERSKYGPELVFSASYQLPVAGKGQNHPDIIYCLILEFLVHFFWFNIVCMKGRISKIASKTAIIYFSTRQSPPQATWVPQYPLRSVTGFSLFGGRLGQKQ